jgi:dTMP kinase
MKKKQKGRFIVIDGTDGSGKATQTKKLVYRLRRNGKKVKTIDFPRYYNNFFGKLVGECLIGKYGDWTKTDPHIASVIYAADRWESGKMIESWLDQGYFVIADRYTSSNQIHQGGKVLNGRKRREFMEWLEKLEFKVFKIPRPDLIIYLDVPLEIIRKLMRKEDKSLKKSYQKGKRDMHETDPKHLENAKKSAIKMIKDNNNWLRISCVKKGELMSINEISDLIWDGVAEYLK